MGTTMRKYLAKLGPSAGMSHVTTRVMGTYGYAAPEYIATGHLYVKSDVYGFGVVLLEMMTGLRALDTRRSGPQHNLVEWSKPMLPNRKKLKRMMDARIEGQYTSKAAILFAQLVLHCLESEPRKRPDMKQVVEVLEQINAMKVKRLEYAIRKESLPLGDSSNRLEKRERETSEDEDFTQKIRAIDDLRNLSIKQLCQQASLRGVSTSGSKKELLQICIEIPKPRMRTPWKVRILLHMKNALQVSIITIVIAYWWFQPIPLL